MKEKFMQVFADVAYQRQTATVTASRTALIDVLQTMRRRHQPCADAERTTQTRIWMGHRTAMIDVQELMIRMTTRSKLVAVQLPM
jgi:hypothetical protein